jgi:branched-chain amino acid transport system substrate-binding protein
MRTKLLETLLVAGIVSWGPRAVGADGPVVIGSIDDLSGVYAEDGGQGSVEAMKMAIADFGGSVLGRRIDTLVADHQNKPDIG